MDLTVLTTFFTKMVAISVAAERMVEILKGWFPNRYPFATEPNPTQEMRRCAIVHVLAGICGGLVSWLGGVNVFTGFATPIGSWASYVGAGLLASAGSAFWNHALDLIQAAKIKKEQAAINAVRANQQNNLVVAAHPASFALAMGAPFASATKAVATLAPVTQCAIQPDPASGGFKSPKGSIALKLNVSSGSFDFVPMGCSASDPNGKPVTFTQKTTNELEFPTNTAGAYSLVVQYFFTPGSVAQLLEDCPGAQSLADLDQNVAVPTIYSFQIS